MSYEDSIQSALDCIENADELLEGWGSTEKRAYLTLARTALEQVR